MAVPGTKSKPDGERINRVAPTHSWTEVAKVPYEGERPAVGRLPRASQQWWSVISTMPHCVLWDAGDWQFAVDTARIHAAFARGDMARAQELRVREKAMGTTMDARRDLRIRYVEPVAETAPSTVPSEVTDFESERRRRVQDAG